MDLQQVTIFGVPLPYLRREEILARCRSFLLSGQHTIATVNPEFLLEARRNDAFHSYLLSTDLNVTDGFGIVLVAAMKGKFGLRRTTGVALTLELCRLAAAEGKRVFLFGGFENTPYRAAEAVRRTLPTLRIVGAENEWDSQGHRRSETEIIASIRNAQPDILFVALGHVQQELWIRDHLSLLSSVHIAVGVGGTFDFFAGRVPRAPYPLQRLGLEWLWRLLVQPWRWKRILNAVIRFPFTALFANRS